MTRGKICCLVLQRSQGDGKSDIFFLWEERLLPTIPVRAKVTRMKVGLYMHDALCDTVVKSSSHPTQKGLAFPKTRLELGLHCIFNDVNR